MFGFSFFGGAVLLTSLLDLAMARVNYETFLVGQYGPIAISALAASIQKSAIPLWPCAAASRDRNLSRGDGQAPQYEAASYDARL